MRIFLSTIFIGVVLGILYFVGCTERQAERLQECCDCPAPTPPTSRIRVQGYWENWNNVVWWDEAKPGKCLLGCIDSSFESQIAPYTDVVFSFILLSSNASSNALYNQTNCSPASNCPAWDGKALYLFDTPVAGDISDAVKQSPCVAKKMQADGDCLASADFSIRDFVLRTKKTGRKAILAVGGWSDWTRIGSVENAQEIARLISAVVNSSGADGVDLDFEHLAEFAKIDAKEFDYFAELVTSLRSQLGGRKLINYTTRLNAFGPVASSPTPYAYQDGRSTLADYRANGLSALPANGLTKADELEVFQDPPTAVCKNAVDGTGRMVCAMETDNEGAYLWPKISQSINHVNIMSYDAGNFIIDFINTIAQFEAAGIDKSRITIGFEPGNPAFGLWEGCQMDASVINYVKANNVGGVMIWAINEDPKKLPTNSQFAPVLANFASGSSTTIACPSMMPARRSDTLVGVRNPSPR